METTSLKCLMTQDWKMNSKNYNTRRLHIGSFVLSNSKRTMNNFIHAINGFYTNDVYYGDTASAYIENKHWDKLDKVVQLEKIYYKEKTVMKTEE